MSDLFESHPILKDIPRLEMALHCTIPSEGAADIIAALRALLAERTWRDGPPPRITSGPCAAQITTDCYVDCGGEREPHLMSYGAYLSDDDAAKIVRHAPIPSPLE